MADSRPRESLVLVAGLVVAVVAGVAAYRVVGPYGDGPFGAGYRRLVDSASGRTTLVYQPLGADESVRALVDPYSRRLTEFRFDADRDGRPEATAMLAEDGLVRVARDVDADGMVDRWEYRGLDRALVKVGLSLAGDDVVDAWAYYDDDGALTRVEVSTARDGVVDRWEHYEADQLVRLEEDTTGDGHADRWSSFAGGIVTETGDLPTDRMP